MKTLRLELRILWLRLPRLEVEWRPRQWQVGKLVAQFYSPRSHLFVRRTIRQWGPIVFFGSASLSRRPKP